MTRIGLETGRSPRRIISALALIVLAFAAATGLVYAMPGLHPRRAIVFAWLTFEAVGAVTSLALIELGMAKRAGLKLAGLRAVGSVPNERLMAFTHSVAERVESAYATAANVMFALGMIGSAIVFLRALAAVDDATRALGEIPLAFFSTAFAVACGAILLVCGHLSFNEFVRAGGEAASEVDAFGVAVPREKHESHEDLKLLSSRVGTALDRFATDSESFGKKLEGLTTAVGTMNKAVATRDEQNEKVLKNIETLVDATKTSAVAVATVIQKPVADAARQLSADVPEMTKAIRELRADTAALHTALTTERKGLLEQHTEGIRRQSEEIMKDAFQRFAQVAESSLKTHVETIKSAIDRHASDVYAKAYTEAATKLQDTLATASKETKELSEKMRQATNDLTTVKEGMEALSTSFTGAASSARTTASEAAAAVESVAAAVERLHGLVVSDGNTGFLEELSEAAGAIESATGHIGSQLQALNDERTRLATIKSRLLEIARHTDGFAHG